MEQKRTANRLQSVGLVGKAIDAFYADLREAPSEGKGVAFCDGFPLPFPILRAMDIPYVFGDAYSAMVAARHKEGRLQEIAEERGYIREVCSYTRNAMGSTLFPEEEKGQAHPLWLLPKADCIIATDPGCSMLVNWGDDERRRFKVPMFLIQIPHIWEGDEEDYALQDVIRQLKEMVVFVEDIFHRKLDWDRFGQIMQNVKVSASLRVEAMKLCRAQPSPATFFDWATALGGVNYMLGKPECIELYQQIKDEVSQKIARKEGAVANEQYRLYMDGIMCWPKLGHLAEKFARLGACVVAGRYTHLGFYSVPEVIDPAKPLESLAANTIALHLNHNYDWLVEAVSELCQYYNIDGIVCHAHRTCRPLAAPQLQMMEGVSRKLGIPGVFFEADMADETFYSDAQVDTRIQALLENIAARRKRR